jgi:hypothetical protein
LPLIGDSLNWEDKQKKKGYSIVKGNAEKVVHLERGKRIKDKINGLNKDSQIAL